MPYSNDANVIGERRNDLKLTFHHGPTTREPLHITKLYPGAIIMLIGSLIDEFLALEQCTFPKCSDLIACVQERMDPGLLCVVGPRPVDAAAALHQLVGKHQR